MAVPFFWGPGGRPMTYEELERQRELEERQAMRAGDSSPVGHWLQGAARVADALAGNVRRGRIDSQLAEANNANSAAIGQLFGGGMSAATPASSPVTPQPAPPVETPSAPVQPQSGNPGVPPNMAQGQGMGAVARAMMQPQLPAGSSVPEGGMRVVSAGPGFTDYQMPDGRTVRRQGTFAWRNNNPGNIEDGNFARSQPGYLSGGGRFAAFDTLDAGNAARERLMFESPSYRDLPLSAAINRYAPPSENNTGRYIASLAAAAGVSPDTIMSAMTPQQRAALMAEQNRVEGLRPGREITLAAGSGIPANAPADGPTNVPALALAPQSAPSEMMPVPQRPGGVPVAAPPPQAPVQVASLDPSAGVVPTPQPRPAIPPQAAAPQMAAAPAPAPVAAPVATQPAPQTAQPLSRVAQALGLGGGGVPPGGNRVGQFAGQDQLAGAKASGSIGSVLGALQGGRPAQPAPAPVARPVAAPAPAAQPMMPPNAAPTQGAPLAPQMQPQTGAAAQQVAAGPNVQQLIAIANNPQLPAGTRNMAIQQLAAMQQRQAEMASPEYQLKMQKLQQEVAAGTRPPTTDDIREYEYAKQQGFAGSFAEFQVRMAEARRSQVSIDQRSQTALEKSLGEAVGKTIAGMYEEGAQAGQDLAQIERLRGLLGQSGSGLGSGLVNMAAGFGIKLGDNAGPGQAASAIISYLTPRQRVPGSGASSDRDLAMFKNALPNMMNTPEGNNLIIDTMQGLAEYKRMQGDIAGRVVMGEIDPKEAIALIRQLPDPFAKFKAVSGQQPGATSKDGWTTLPNGVRIREKAQ